MSYNNLEEAAQEYSFNIPSKIYQSCKTQEEMKQWKDEIENSFIAGAEWQKQKDLKDFLEKAEMYIKTRVYYNMHPNNITTAIQEFKKYIENEM